VLDVVHPFGGMDWEGNGERRPSHCDDAAFGYGGGVQSCRKRESIYTGPKGPTHSPRTAPGGTCLRPRVKRWRRATYVCPLAESVWRQHPCNLAERRCSEIAHRQIECLQHDLPTLEVNFHHLVNRLSRFGQVIERSCK